MKKKLTLALICIATLALSFALVGCDSDTSNTATDNSAKDSSATETSTATTNRTIKLGGNLGDYVLEGECYGDNYQVIDTPDSLKYEDTESTVYYCANCDTPYIVVYRWDSEGRSLEDWTKELAGEENAHYEIVEDGDYDSYGYYCTYSEGSDGEFYYCAIESTTDGDDIVEICFASATKEVALAGSDLYIYLPTGYEDTTAEDKTDVKLLSYEYEDCYYLPEFWIDVYEGEVTYEQDVESWTTEYDADEFPISKKEWNSMHGDGAGWTSEQAAKYYKAFGYKLIESNAATEVCGAEVSFDIIREIDEDDDTEQCSVTYIATDNRVYEVWLMSDKENFPSYTKTLIGSIHTK